MRTIKQDFEMNGLITIEVVAIYVCVLAITRDTLNSCCGFAMTTVFKLLNLIASRSFAIPFVNDYPIVNGLIPTVFTFFLFAGIRHKDNNGNGNGNGYFFHMAKIINAPLICKL